MMKKSTRIVSLILTLSMLMSLCVSVVYALPGTITGQGKVETQNIKLGNTDTGVSLTQILLTEGSKYSLGTTGIVNVIEFKPSDKVALKVFNGGAYNWSKATAGASAVAYNRAHDDSTVLAAVNGDPWLVYHTDYDGDGQKATGPSVKHVSVSRGIMIIDGELWASHQINDENNLARTDNAERGTPAARGPVFAIKADGTAMIGTPTIAVNLINTTTDKTVKADGINRLPAPNSVILYNHRCGTESFAYEDAYELYLDCSDPAFSLSKPTAGKVVAIFESGDTADRPAIDEHTVVISARGSSISRIKGQFKVGDTVSVTSSVIADSDVSGQASVWVEAKEAIGGFFYLLKNGNAMGQPGNTTNYPCSIIGVTKDGTIQLTSTTSIEDGTRQACQMTNLPALCKELGYKTAILFDGGGSTTMVTLSGDKYVRRSAAVDGANSVRSVINGVLVTYAGVNQEPTNAETKNTAFYPSLGIEQTPGEILPEGVDFVGKPSYSYRYYADVQTVNGDKQENLIGLRNPAVWNTGDKPGSIDPAVLSGAVLGEDRKISLSGYAFVNGGQGDHYWSLDLENWHACTDGVYSDGDTDMENTATVGADMNSTHLENACFENVTADLSAYAGKTVTVYFGITAKADKSKICHYLTVEEVAVPAALWSENKNIVLHQSFDELRVNGSADTGIFTPGQFAGWNKVAEVDTRASSLAYWGWVALNDEVGLFGYRIGDAEPVFDEAFAYETEQGVLDAAAGVSGSTGASRMLIHIDISSLSGSHTVQTLYKNPNGDVTILCEFEVIRTEAPVETIPETEPATEPTTEPTTDEAVTDATTDTTDIGTEPTTDATTSASTSVETDAPDDGGCASAMFGVAGLTLLCGAALVMRKHKA